MTLSMSMSVYWIVSLTVSLPSFTLNRLRVQPPISLSLLSLLFRRLLWTLTSTIETPKHVCHTIDSYLFHPEYNPYTYFPRTIFGRTRFIEMGPRYPNWKVTVTQVKTFNSSWKGVLPVRKLTWNHIQTDHRKKDWPSRSRKSSRISFLPPLLPVVYSWAGWKFWVCLDRNDRRKNLWRDTRGVRVLTLLRFSSTYTFRSPRTS